MDIRYIESFLALAELLNFSRAAQKVNISQSAFSRQIAALENEFDCSLFIRNKRTVELTNFGKEFLPFARRIVSDLEEWKNIQLRVRECGEKHLRIGFLCDLPSEIIPRAVREFKSTHQSVALHFDDRSLTGIITGLLENDFDCAFTMTNDTERLDDFNAIKLATYDLCAILPRTHRLAGEREISLSQLSHENFIGLENESNSSGIRQIEKLCHDAGFTPGITDRVSLVPSLLSMVEFGMGIALLTDAAKDLAPRNVIFVPLKEKEACSHLVLLWKYSNKSAVLREFIESTEVMFRKPPV